MSNQKAGHVFAYTILGLVILYLLRENNNERQKKRQLEEALNSSNLISENLRHQILDLLARHPHIDDDVKNELSQIALLIGLQQETTAILKLAKVIENLLKKLFKNNTEFKEWLKENARKRPQFADYLDFAHFKAIIPKEDYHLITVLKLLRNEEAHELNVTRDKSKLIGCFISGMGITINLYNQFKNQSKAPPKLMPA